MSENNLGPVVVDRHVDGNRRRDRALPREEGIPGLRRRGRDVDGEALKAQASDELTPLVLDVIDEATISAAAMAVGEAAGERGLAGLVKNAGTAKPAPIEFQPTADFRTQLELNLFAPVATVQALLPLIRQGGGRS